MVLTFSLVSLFVNQNYKIMILIISQSHHDITTDYVVDWLGHMNADFIRVNGFDLLLNMDFSHDFSLSNFVFHKEEVTTDEISVVWYRRWANMDKFPKEYSTTSQIVNSERVIGYMKDEFRGLKEFFFEAFRNKNWLHKPAYLRESVVEKPLQLKIADNVKLNIPATFITTSKEALINFCVENDTKDFIVKNLKMVGMFKNPATEKPVATYTKSISLDEIKTLPSSFSPMLVQEKIHKSFEIRVFHIDGENYSMAIFSQLSEDTVDDFRNYSSRQRMIPFKLPEDILQKINKFMELIGLRTGSIDLLYSKDGKYYFLEVNPEGQFGMVSIPCNYYIEKIIAEKLMTYDER